MMNNISAHFKRLAVIYTIVILIAAAHILRVGSHLEGAWYNLYYSYFSDFILPFACYFLLSGFELRVPQTAVPAPLLKTLSLPRRWEVKLATAFLLPAIAETCQYFGIPVLGVTFDPLDYLMYALGAISAVVVDTRVLPRFFGFWTVEEAGREDHLPVFKAHG